MVALGSGLERIELVYDLRGGLRMLMSEKPVDLNSNDWRAVQTGAEVVTLSQGEYRLEGSRADAESLRMFLTYKFCENSNLESGEEN